MKIIEVCDINSEGHKVRLSDGSYDTIPHNTGSVSVGEEWPPVKLDIETGAVTVAPTLAELNSDAQIGRLANILSEKVKEIKPQNDRAEGGERPEANEAEESGNVVKSSAESPLDGGKDALDAPASTLPAE